MNDCNALKKALTCRAENRPVKDCGNCEYRMPVGKRIGCDFVRISSDALSLLNEKREDEEKRIEVAAEARLKSIVGAHEVC